MATALKALPDLDVLYVRKERRPATFADAAMVETTKSLSTDEGVVIPSGTAGAVVAVYDDGASYEIEFPNPVGTLLAIEAKHLRAAKVGA